jgi:RNA polymerase sigma-70 factor (ECF subfamily)
MFPADSTCWSVIQEAARGDADARGSFVRDYRPLIQEYLRVRWARSLRIASLEDAVQDVLLECLKSGGLLVRTSGNRPRSFRAFLLGAARNIALRYESGRSQGDRETSVPLADFESVAGNDERASQAFERAWARAIVRDAARHMMAHARILGREAVRRVEILRLRFFEGMPIREIAAVWGEDSKAVHRDYARAREEYRGALFDVLDFHHPGRPDEAREEATRLVEILSLGTEASPDRL